MSHVTPPILVDMCASHQQQPRAFGYPWPKYCYAVLNVAVPDYERDYYENTYGDYDSYSKKPHCGPEQFHELKGHTCIDPHSGKANMTNITIYTPTALYNSVNCSGMELR